MPSISTPIQPSYTDTRTERRPRRHTIINRPDSAMGLLSDMEDDEQEQQETFDRISGILSSLIQEANEAVHGQLTTSNSNNTRRIFTSSTIITTNDNSKIPRPRKNRFSNTPNHLSHHHRNVSSSSSSSTSSSNLFSPISTSSSTTISRSPSPLPNNNNLKKQLFRHYTVLRPRSCPVIAVQRRSITPIKHKRNNSNLIVSDPITESFKRLDSSMALVDSLSRDLATPKEQQASSNNFTLLLLVPLLHIPHSLITMIFDFCTFTPNTSTNTTRPTSFSMSSMLFWACVFAVTNLMVDQVAIIPKQYLTISSKKTKTRRMSLPGTYAPIKKSSKVPPARKVKQTWIPTTLQQQSQFRLDKEQAPKRRNSI